MSETVHVVSLSSKSRPTAVPPSNILPVLDKKKLYFDCNATTPMAPEVIEAVNVSMKETWGNPSSAHEEGSKAKKAIKIARQEVASMISAHPKDVIFVSGGTEANNMVIYSVVVHFRKWVLSQSNSSSFAQMKPHIITTKVEHDSIKFPLKHRYFIEADVTYLGVDNLPNAVIDNIRPNTCLISVMLANNETGIIFSVAHIARLLNEVNKKREAEGYFRILLHSDAAQAIGKIPVDVMDLHVDFLTIAGHKFYGPRIGALYVRSLENGAPLYPMFYGGGQEKGLRSGTENTPMIVGFGKACSLVQENISDYSAHMKKMRVYLEKKLKGAFSKFVKINCVDPCITNNPEECSVPPKGPKQMHIIFPRLPNTVSVSFYYPEVTGQEILNNCEQLMASTGAACHADKESQSVLESSGVCSFHAIRTIRLSLGRDTNWFHIDAMIIDLNKAISKSLDPLKITTASSSNST